MAQLTCEKGEPPGVLEQEALMRMWARGDEGGDGSQQQYGQREEEYGDIPLGRLVRRQVAVVGVTLPY